MPISPNVCPLYQNDRTFEHFIGKYFGILNLFYTFVLQNCSKQLFWTRELSPDKDPQNEVKGKSSRQKCLPLYSQYSLKAVCYVP